MTRDRAIKLAIEALRLRAHEYSTGATLPGFVDDPIGEKIARGYSALHLETIHAIAELEKMLSEPLVEDYDGKDLDYQVCG